MRHKTYRIKYFTNGKPGALTFSCVLQDTEDAIFMFAEVNTLPGERCMVEDLNGRTIWDWTMKPES